MGSSCPIKTVKLKPWDDHTNPRGPEIEYSDPLRLRRGCLFFHTTSPGGVSPRRCVCRVFQEGSPALMPLQRASALPAPNSPLTPAPRRLSLVLSLCQPPASSHPLCRMERRPCRALRCTALESGWHHMDLSKACLLGLGMDGEGHGTHTHQCTHNCRSDRFRTSFSDLSLFFAQSRLTPLRSRRPSSSLQRLPRSRLFQ